MKKTLTAIAIALLTVGTLTGCGGVQTEDEVVEFQKTLSDGRTVTCLVMKTYKYDGGISCDW